MRSYIQNRKLLLVFLTIVVTLLLIVGCDDQVQQLPQVPANENNQPSNGEQKLESIDYTPINATELPLELQTWYQENYNSAGMHVEQHAENQYILISAGERMTGGYKITSVKLYAKSTDLIEVSAVLEVPAEDEMVTMALTYPYVIIKKDIDQRELQYLGLEEVTRTLTDKADEVSGLDIGIYQGQADNNSVEIKLNETNEYRVFQLTDDSREQLKSINDGDLVEFSWLEVVGQQDKLLTIKKQ